MSTRAEIQRAQDNVDAAQRKVNEARRAQAEEERRIEGFVKPNESPALKAQQVRQAAFDKKVAHAQGPKFYAAWTRKQEAKAERADQQERALVDAEAEIKTVQHNERVRRARAEIERKGSAGV